MVRAATFILAGLATLAMARGAAAQVSLIGGLGGPAGFGTRCLSPNDDGSSAAVDLRGAFPDGLRFYADTYSSLYVNTNGNVTFRGPLSTFTPRPFPVSSVPMIAAYWGDVDIRPPTANCGGLPAGGGPGDGPCQNPASNGVWWSLERGRLVVTWDRVGYFSCHVDHVMSFQLILTDARACGVPGDFDVEFRYNRCEWTSGDASGGTGGFGGTPAQAGFDAGDNVHFQVIPGSMMGDIHTRLCTRSNVDHPGIWYFSIRNGGITTDAGTQNCGTGACLRTVARCASGIPVTCTPGTPVREVCNLVDDDCNGLVDDGVQSCGRGACVRMAPLCRDGAPVRCVAGPPVRELCGNGRDDDCDGVLDNGCRPDVEPVDAADDTDVPEDACRDRWCLRLQGRAGPLGGCACHVHGAARGPGPGAWPWGLAVGLAVAACRRRRGPGIRR